MCSRYTIIGTRILSERFAIPPIPPRYNAAPGQRLLIITTEDKLTEAVFGIMGDDGRRRINARFEGMERKTRGREERCTIPASGFYEWKTGGMRKQPYYIFFPERELVAFAGIYDRGREAFCIVTRAAVEPVSRIHPRMPFVLTEKGEAEWLAGAINPPSEEVMDMYAVSKEINNSVVPDKPSLILRPDRHHWW